MNHLVVIGQQNCTLMKGATSTRKVRTRLKVLNSVLEDQLAVCKASEKMGVSERHTRRIRSIFGIKGVRAISHGDHGILKAIEMERGQTGTKSCLVIR